MDTQKDTEKRFEASMILAGVGDCLAFNNGEWEFKYKGEEIHKELAEMGGIEKLKGDKKIRIVSDDTVMLIATARGIVEYFYCYSQDESQDSSLDEITNIIERKQKRLAPTDKMYVTIGKKYVECLNDMNGRAPGATCINGVKQMNLNNQKGYLIPFNPTGGGCGGAMRSMCIGLLYSDDTQLDNLIAVSIETGRMSHHHPVGYLGSLASAFLVHCAVNRYEPRSWGKKLMDLEPRAKEYITSKKFEVEKNTSDQHWNYFWTKWRDYLKLRKIESGDTQPVFPPQMKTDAVFRDQEYTKWSFQGWAGSSGHDAPMIAYDGFLLAGKDWKLLTDATFFHGGDSDSTGVIVGAIYGAMYGLSGVPLANYQNLEYFEELKALGSDMWEIQSKVN